MFIRAMLFVSTFIFAALLSGCQGISVQTQYYSHADLASTFIKTPDPRQTEDFIGQRLVISYSFPKSYLDFQDLTLHLKVRFKNGQEDEHFKLLRETSGDYIYKLENQEFLSKGDIITCLVEVTGNGEVLETWKHPLWVELIKIEI